MTASATNEDRLHRTILGGTLHPADLLSRLIVEEREQERKRDDREHDDEADPSDFWGLAPEHGRRCAVPSFC